MINLADINRAGHWMNTHKIPLLPKVMQLIAFLFYSSAVSYKVKIGKGTFFNHGGFGVLINSNVVIGDCCKIGNNVSIVGQGPYKCVPVLKDRVYVGGCCYPRSCSRGRRSYHCAQCRGHEECPSGCNSGG